MTTIELAPPGSLCDRVLDEDLNDALQAILALNTLYTERGIGATDRRADIAEMLKLLGHGFGQAADAKWLPDSSHEDHFYALSEVRAIHGQAATLRADLLTAVLAQKPTAPASKES